MTRVTDYWRHVARPIRDDHGRLVGYQMPTGGTDLTVLLARPPFRRLAGKRATAAGRGHRASQRGDAIGARRALVLEAWRLRVTEGQSIRAIAAQLGRSPSLVGRWLRGIPAVGGRVLDDLDVLEADVARLVAESERRRLPGGEL